MTQEEHIIISKDKFKCVIMNHFMNNSIFRMLLQQHKYQYIYSC